MKDRILEQMRAGLELGQPMNFPSWLALLFIGLKLAGHIDWNWVWVLSPLWIPTLFFGSLLLVCLAIYAIIK